MKISEFIDKLNAIKSENDDIDVACFITKLWEDTILELLDDKYLQVAIPDRELVGNGIVVTKKYLCIGL